MHGGGGGGQVPCGNQFDGDKLQPSLRRFQSPFCLERDKEHRDLGIGPLGLNVTLDR